MATIVVSGAIANKPRNGGEAWLRISWIESFRRAGHDVHFIEQISPQACFDDRGEPCRFESSVNLAHFREVVEAFGLSGNASLICGDGLQCEGLRKSDLLNLASNTRLLVNISGNLQWPALLSRIHIKAYFDTDPGFTQF